MERSALSKKFKVSKVIPLMYYKLVGRILRYNSRAFAGTYNGQAKTNQRCPALAQQRSKVKLHRLPCTSFKPFILQIEWKKNMKVRGKWPVTKNWKMFVSCRNKEKTFYVRKYKYVGRTHRPIPLCYKEH